MSDIVRDSFRRVQVLDEVFLEADVVHTVPIDVVDFDVTTRQVFDGAGLVRLKQHVVLGAASDVSPVEGEAD